jgi:hypothetical protein
MASASFVFVLMLALALGATVGPISPATAQTEPDRCASKPGTQRHPCVGPVTNESGGGGDTLTIVVSVLVGLTVAGVAVVLLRRELGSSPEVARDPSPSSSGDR